MKTVTVRYFASLRERMGRDQDQVDAQSGATVAQIWQQVSGGRPRPANLLCAVNLEYVSWETQVQAGDEVGFFPPVTGG